MNDMMKEIDEAFKLLSAIHVAGDAVDVMAGVREHLRHAYKLAASEPMDTVSKEVEPDGGQDDR